MSSENHSYKEKLEIKTEFFASMTNMGMQDELKKQLRMQICERLKQKDLLKSHQSHNDRLFNRIVASLVSQLLLQNDCGYSNSIYVAESGYDMKTLNRSEIIDLMGIQKGSLDEQRSILQNMIKKSFPFSEGTRKAVAVQTCPEQIGYTLEQRLTIIDHQYRQNLLNPLQSQDIDYKQKLTEVELDLKRNYQRDNERFKQFESHSIKVKVSQDWRKKFEQYARNLANQYRIKLETVKKRERLREDQLINRNKVLDEKVNGSHKTFLHKIDILDIKSSTVEETKKNLDIERKRTKEEYSQLQKQLKAKVREYDSLLLNLNSKIQYEVGVAKLAIQQEYQQKNTEFLNKKKFIDQQYGKLMGIKDSTDLIRQQSKRLFEQNLRLRKDLSELQKQFRFSVSEQATQNQRLDSLRSQKFKTEKLISHKKQEQQELHQKCKRKEEQISSMRNELDELRQWREKHEQISQQEEEGIQISPNARFGTQILKSELQNQMDSLKKQRKRQIQKLKMQLLS